MSKYIEYTEMKNVIPPHALINSDQLILLILDVRILINLEGITYYIKTKYLNK